MSMFRKAFVVLPLAIAGCVGQPAAPPVRPPVIRPAPAPLPVAPAANWENGVLTPGGWTYLKDTRGGQALYGTVGRDPILGIRCDIIGRRIYVSRQGSIATRMTLRATTGAKAYDAKPMAGAGPNGSVPYVSAEVLPTDPQLDALAFSRGRLLVASSGATDIVVPSWPEVARVIEDCRG